MKNLETGVTPLAGVWIEIEKIFDDPQLTAVTPLAGVWIEIVKWIKRYILICHSPCGSVD